MEIDEAKEFIVGRVINPALNSRSISQKSKESIKKTRQWIEHCKFVGDLFAYISRFTGEGDRRYETVYSELKKYGLTPIEDIKQPFINKFKDSLDECLKISDMQEGESYSSWDISIMARVFNIQRGIYLLENEGIVEGVLTKVTMGGDGDYPNYWIEYGYVLKHYMLEFKGKTDINFKANKAIIESNGKPIHVFLKEGIDCNYAGIFDFDSFDESNDGSKWFILKKRSQEKVFSLNKYKTELEKNVQSALRFPKERRREIIACTNKIPVRKSAITQVFIRNPYIIAEVLLRAAGVCEFCNQTVPFLRAIDNTPFLEVHHKIPLANGGEDSLENTVAVCPNCHRKAHFG